MNFRENFLNELRAGRIIKGDKTFRELAIMFNYPDDNGDNLCKKDYYRFLKNNHEKTAIKAVEGSTLNNRDNSKSVPDLQKYNLSSFKINKDGEVCDQWYRSQGEEVPSIDYKSLFKEALIESVIKPTMVKTPINDSDKLLVINATDIHLNKKYFQKATTLEEQINTARKAVTYILNQAGKVDKILFIIGHDFLHSEFTNMTTKGTPQDTLEPAEVVFKQALKLLINCVEYATLFAPVDVIMCNGNHAYNAELQLFSALEVYYETFDNQYITFSSNRADRQYYTYGENSFMLIHDTRNKVSDLPLLFSIEKPEYFVKKNKYILSGHLHSKKETSFVSSNENFGIEHIQCPSLSGTDRWHHDNMYVGNKERMLGLVIDKTKGIVNHIIFNK